MAIREFQMLSTIRVFEFQNAKSRPKVLLLMLRPIQNRINEMLRLGPNRAGLTYQPFPVMITMMFFTYNLGLC